MRARQRRNFLATLLLSQGVPMLGHGDELGRGQGGNNNAYCQDGDLSYVDWEGADEQLLLFTQRAIALRTAHRIFRRRRFFTGRPVQRADGALLPDLAWFSFDGRTMSEDDWSAHFGRSVALFLNCEGIRERSPIGERHTDDSFLLLFNGSEIMLEFVLPPADYGGKWGVVLDTSQATGLPAAGEPVVVAAGATVPVPDRCMLVLSRLG